MDDEQSLLVSDWMGRDEKRLPTIESIGRAANQALQSKRTRIKSINSTLKDERTFQDAKDTEKERLTLKRSRLELEIDHIERLFSAAKRIAKGLEPIPSEYTEDD